MDPATFSLLASLGVLLVLLALGVHIGVTLALAGIVGSYMFLGNWTAGMNMLFIQSMDVSSAYTLMVIPLFIVLGSLASASGITGDLFLLFYRWFGRVHGGVAIATIGTCAGMASITGSSVATSAAMSRIAMPELEKYKYDKALSVGAIATGGTLSIMIPPSITLVLYAIFAQQSVGKMLVAGIIPGIILTLGYAALIYVRCLINPALGPAGPRFSLRQRLEILPAVIPFIAIIAAVILGILFGIWTPVESAAVAVVLVAMIAFTRRRLNLKSLIIACREAVVMSASVFIIVIGSLVYSGFLAMNGFSDLVAQTLIDMQLGPFPLFCILFVLYLILGMFMEVSSLLALTIPLVMPIVATVGWDPVWFGVIVVAMMEIAAVTPPIGLNLYAVKAALPEIQLQTIYRGAVQFWLVNVFVIFFLYMYPWIVLILPNMR
jgi:C4-dicarboxylate transporter, DctM subunit